MWSSLLTGGTSPSAQQTPTLAPPKETDERPATVAAAAATATAADEYGHDGDVDGDGDNFDDDSAEEQEQQRQQQGGLFGNRFDYMSQMASRIIHQVSSSEEPDNKGRDDDNGWNEDDDDDDPLDNLTDERNIDTPLLSIDENATAMDQLTDGRIPDESLVNTSTPVVTTAETLDTTTTSAAAIGVDEDESENVWGDDDDDDLDVSHSDRQNDAATERIVLAPPLVETELELSERAVAEQLDSVLQQIQEQEVVNSPRTTVTTGVASEVAAFVASDDDDDGATSLDEEHCDEAVLQIQQELGAVMVSRNPQAVVATINITTPMVDHTPHQRHHHHPVGMVELVSSSSVVPAELDDDVTRDTGYGAAAGDANESLLADDDVYADENEHEYGLVVDHTPSKASAVPFCRADSLMAQAEHRDHEGREDATMSVSESGWRDENDGGGTISDDGDNDENNNTLVVVEPNVVDHTPLGNDDEPVKERRNRSLSIGVLASLGETVEDVAPDDGKEMDETHEFGPVVDVTPETPAAAAAQPHLVAGTSDESLAVHAAEIQDDFAADEAMDFTYYGDSTVGGVATEGPDEDGNGTQNTDDWESDDDDDEALTTNTDECDRKMPPLVSMEPKRATFSPNIATFEHHLVDHTPSELPYGTIDGVGRTKRDPSIIALAASEDETRDTGLGADEEVFDDENELAYGLVVDQTPETPGSALSVSGANSLAVHASTMKQDIEDDEAMDDTSYNGSTLGDGETTAAEWGDADDDERKVSDRDLTLRPGECNVALVDHTPSEIDSPTKFGGPSVDVQGSIANTVETGEADSTGEAHVAYGPVVDQTPTTPALSTYLMSTRSDSVIVQGKDDVDSVDDETTIMGGSRIGYGDETIDEVLPEEMVENQVVDFLPPQSASRHGDGSTLVAADPSEVMSEVDDLAPDDEQIFGPVVDLTPQTRDGPGVFELPSGEGSTVVFVPPSVAADDLDPEEEGDNGADQEGWSNGDLAVEEEPNPQSGNEEPAVLNRVNEQLVDFLPPPSNNIPDVSDATREALSEMTVGGAQSLLQGGDPIEDDFGPVVDQLPSTARSHASTATQLSVSEYRAMEKDDRVNDGDDMSSIHVKEKVLVDHLPVMDRKRNVDSIATMGLSQLSEEEEEEEVDACKFGPVVDQLPTSRASIAPSRGGSTVDALATVSEGTSDDEEGDVWDDDVDFDASLGGVSETTDRHGVAASSRLTTPSMDTDRSVRFDSSANESRATIQSRAQYFDHDIETAVPQGGQYNDPEVLSNSETQYFDPDQGPENGWDDALRINDVASCIREPRAHELPDKSFAEADTPPSTPYRKPDSCISMGTDGANDPEMSVPLLSIETCMRCTAVHDTDCPCIVRLLAENISVVGSLIAPDGASVDVTKLLKDEITRRRLVEEEVKALQDTVGPQKLIESLMKARENELEQARDEALSNLLESRQDADKLREVNSKVLGEILLSRTALNELERKQTEFVAKEGSFQAEIASLRQSLMLSSSHESFDDRLASLQADFASKTGECELLVAKARQLEMQLSDAEKMFAQQSLEVAEHTDVLKHSLDSLKEQLSGSEALVKSTEAARIQLELKIYSLEAELKALRSSKLHVKNESELRSRELRNLEELTSTLQVEKSSLIADLMQQRALAEQTELLADELLSVAKERDLLAQSLNESKLSMLGLQKVIDERGVERQTTDSDRNEENLSFRKQLRKTHDEFAFVEKAPVGVTSQLRPFAIEKGVLEANIHTLPVTETADVVRSANTAQAGIRADEIESLKRDLEMVSREREKFRGEVLEATAQVVSLREGLAQAKDESLAHFNRSSELEKEVFLLREISDSLVEEKKIAILDRDETEAKCEKMDTDYVRALEEFEKQSEQCKTDYQRDLSDLAQRNDALFIEVECLREAETQHQQALEEVERNAQGEARRYDESTALLCDERDRLRQDITRLEYEMKELKVLSVSKATENDAPSEVRELLETKESLQNEVALYKERLVGAERERDELHALIPENQGRHENELAALNNECDQLRNDVSQLRANEAQHNQALTELQERTDESTNSYKQEVERLVAECEELRRQANQLQAVSDELRTERGRLEEVMLERDGLREENEELLVQFGLQEQKLDEACTSAAVLRAELESLQTTNVETSASLESLHRDKCNLEERIHTIVTERDSLMEQVSLMETDAASKVESLQVLMNEMETQIGDLKLQATSKQEDIVRLTQEAADASSQKADLKAEVTVLTTEVEEQKAALLVSIKDTQVLEQKLTETNDALVIASRKSMELDQILAKRDEEHTTLADELRLRSENFASELQVAQDRIKETETSLASNNEASTLLKETQVQVRHLETVLADKDATIAALQQSLDTLQAEVKPKEANHAMEVQALQRQIDIVNEALQATRCRLTSKEDDMSRLCDELSVLRAAPPSAVPSGSVVARAIALQRSAEDRAEAMRRLEADREEYRETLHRLSESCLKLNAS